MRLRLALGLAALLTISCLPQANAEPLVFIVSYHNVDYAQTACNFVLSQVPGALETVHTWQKYGWGEVTDETTKYILAGAAECKSVRDTRELGRRLENELIDALAIEFLCAGVTVIRDPHPDFDRTGNFSQSN